MMKVGLAGRVDSRRLYYQLEYGKINMDIGEDRSLRNVKWSAIRREAQNLTKF